MDQDALEQVKCLVFFVNTYLLTVHNLLSQSSTYVRLVRPRHASMPRTYSSLL
jgi:hypothetical protein